MKQPQTLTCTARWDRELVGCNGGQNHLLLDIVAQKSGRMSDRPPLNLALVIDASGSMTGEPLAAAKRAVLGVLDMLRPDDRLTVVSFANDVILHADGIAADTAGCQRVRGAVAELQTRGATDLAAGWLAGCRALARVMDGHRLDTASGPFTQNRVLILSDGYANCGIVAAQELGEHAAALRQRGIISSTVGVGDDYCPTQLAAIAAYGGGRLHDAPFGEDIVAVVLGEIGEAMVAVAEDINIGLELPAGMEAVVRGRYPVSYTDAGLRVALGSLVGSGSRQLVLRLEGPPVEIGTRLDVTMSVDWLDPRTGGRHTGTPLTTSLAVVAASAAAAAEYDQQVGRIVARMWHDAVELDATLFNSDGDVERATGLVDREMPAFVDYCALIKGTASLVEDLHEHRSLVAEPMEPACYLESVATTAVRLQNVKQFRRNQRQ